MGGAVWILKDATTAKVCDENGYLCPVYSFFKNNCFGANVECVYGRWIAPLHLQCPFVVGLSVSATSTQL